MVIKFTVNDNDYYFCLQSFIKSLFRWFALEPCKLNNMKEFFEAEDAYSRFMKLLNPNNNEKLTGEHKQFIIEYIRNRFDSYIRTSNYDDNERKLLMRDFKVNIQNSFVDRWENGESFYWLQHSGTVINQ